MRPAHSECSARGIAKALNPICPRSFDRGQTETGGGGGTACPQLSLRAGLCLPPLRPDGTSRRRSVLSDPCGSDPSARPRFPVGGSISLYRAGLELASFLPLGVAMPPSWDGAVRFHRCEPRFLSARASRSDPRSNPRPQALDFRIYVHSRLFDSHRTLPERQGRRTASRR